MALDVAVLVYDVAGMRRIGLELELLGFQARGLSLWHKNGDVVRIARETGDGAQLVGCRLTHVLTAGGYGRPLDEARLRLTDPAQWFALAEPRDIGWRLDRFRAQARDKQAEASPNLQSDLQTLGGNPDE